MKKFVQNLLERKVRALLAAHKPRIVAVTGSVGKTSTKNAIATVLAGKFRVRATAENYNNELGVPLAILGMKSPGRSILGWIAVLTSAQKNFPEVLVLEYGADHPGDIKKLCELGPPEIGVVTALSPVHVANFSSYDQLIAEKAELVKSLPEGGRAVLNADDERVRAFETMTKAPVVTYGFSPANVQASGYLMTPRDEFSFDPGDTFATTTAHVKTANGEGDVQLKNALGKQQVSAALAAIAVGEQFGMSLDEMLPRLAEKYAPPNGRLRPLPGIKGTLVLDDSYNAAPASTAAALNVLREFEPAEDRRRIAVLGDMAELGSLTEQEHRQIGLQAAADVDILVCVGEKARDMCRGAEEAGMDAEHVLQFATAEEAGRWLDPNIKKGDIVLVKGSQSMRMEKAVKEIMAEPLRANELLVRQYGKWLES